MQQNTWIRLYWKEIYWLQIMRNVYVYTKATIHKAVQSLLVACMKRLDILLFSLSHTGRKDECRVDGKGTKSCWNENTGGGTWAEPYGETYEVSITFHFPLQQAFEYFSWETCFCLCKNKGADQMLSYHAADQHRCFRYIEQSLDFINLKFQASSYLWLHNLVCIGPGQKTAHREVVQKTLIPVPTVCFGLSVQKLGKVVKY